MNQQFRWMNSMFCRNTPQNHLLYSQNAVARGKFSFNSRPGISVILQLTATHLLIQLISSEIQTVYFCLLLSHHLKYRISLSDPNFKNSPCWALSITLNEDQMHFNSIEEGSPLPWDAYLKKIGFKWGFQQDYKPYRKLGKGATASVMEVVKKSDNSHFAVKAISKAYLNQDSRLKQAFINQIAMLRYLTSFNHKNLPSLHEVYQSENTFYLLQTLFIGGSLINLMKDVTDGLSNQNIKQIMRQLLQSLFLLHCSQIVHRDIKLSNLMFRSRSKESLDLVINDFGLAIDITEQGEQLFTRCGTPGYMAPEIFEMRIGDKLENTACDIFSAGVIFHILVTGKGIFEGETKEDILVNNSKMNFNLSHEIINSMGEDCFDLLRRMLTINPMERVTAKDALKHSYFQECKGQLGFKSPAPTINTNHILQLDFSQIELGQNAKRTKKEYRKASQL